MRTLLLACAISAGNAGCDTVHDEPPTWSYIHAAIIAPSCATASCHSKISSVTGRDMSTPHAAYTALTNRVCGAPPHAGMDDLENARGLVMSALRGTQYLIMPPDQPLPDVEIDLIDRWYAAGAPCD